MISQRRSEFLIEVSRLSRRALESDAGGGDRVEIEGGSGEMHLWRARSKLSMWIEALSSAELAEARTCRCESSKASASDAATGSSEKPNAAAAESFSIASLSISSTYSTHADHVCRSNLSLPRSTLLSCTCFSSSSRPSVRSSSISRLACFRSASLRSNNKSFSSRSSASRAWYPKVPWIADFFSSCASIIFSSCASCWASAARRFSSIRDRSENVFSFPSVASSLVAPP